MRPQWIEAGPLLAAAGHRLAPPSPPPSPWNRLMTQNIDYAFLTRIDAVAKPTIVGSLERLAELIEAISAETSREAQSANIVAANIQHIFAVTEQTGEGTRSTAQMVRELSHTAEELKQSVARFKIV